MRKKATETITAAANKELTAVNQALGLGNIQVGGTPGVSGGGAINADQSIAAVPEDEPGPPPAKYDSAAEAGMKTDTATGAPADTALKTGAELNQGQANEGPVDGEEVPPPADDTTGGEDAGGTGTAESMVPEDSQPPPQLEESI